MTSRSLAEIDVRIRPSDKIPEFSCGHAHPDEGVRFHHPIDITEYYNQENDSLLSQLRSCVRDLVELREMLRPPCSEQLNPAALAKIKGLQSTVQNKGRLILESVSACQVRNDRLSVLFSKYSQAAAPTEAPIPADLLDELTELLP